MIIDFRSDTVTRPSQGMRQAMAEAAVGDDVYGEDPTVRALEQETAKRLGKAAAVFMPTGTMANQAAVIAHVKPGDEIWVHESAHLITSEQGGASRWGHTQTRTLHAPGGEITVPDLSRWARDPDDVHHARPRLLWMENTIGFTGRVLPLAGASDAAAFAHARRLVVHLDGSRLWNAAVATDTPESTLASMADSVSVCFSKGLGAPVGSALAGGEEFITCARRARKALGGGMRQAGIIAAGALYALRENIPRLSEDHRRARSLALHLADCDWCEVNPDQVETNMVFAVVPRAQSEEIVRELARVSVLCDLVDECTLRFVTHLDIDDYALDSAMRALSALKV
jgi:threonine aldolase